MTGAIFPVRVERTSLHRRLKGGVLGYEDEKFSYLIATRPQASRPPPARIVRHPQKHSGHIRLTLCTAQGIEQRTITKSQKEPYKSGEEKPTGVKSFSRESTRIKPKTKPEKRRGSRGFLGGL